MKCKILHKSNGRLRIHMMQKYMSPEQADLLEAYLSHQSVIKSAKVYDRTADAVVLFNAENEQAVIALFAGFSYSNPELEQLDVNHSGRLIQREYEEKLVMAFVLRYAKQLLLPLPLRVAIAYVKTAKYILKALKSLLKGKLEVAVLDAVAVTVSMIRQDYNTAANIMFMLRIGEILEEWTHKKSVDDLAQTLSLNVDKVWKKNPDGEEELVPIDEINVGDNIVVRTGNVVPLDGKVVSGNAMINQASITGEPLSVQKSEGSYVYAGTVVEEGECVFCADKGLGGGKYDGIVKMIEDSEKLKSTTEDKASHLADKLVPYSLGGTVLTWLVTRNAAKALSVLMVDYSCALKLAMPISVLSAIRECSKYDVSVKGGKYLEAVSDADTIVFDKTGTLTNARPRVAKIVTFGGNEEDDMLRLAACLEEHYPHSIANAVVNEALERNLQHRERHSKVEYVVAHGISSAVDGEKVVIGSYHFVFQDENCSVPNGEEEKFAAIPNEYSHLYMAISGKLAAVICIEDPIKENVADAIKALHALGLKIVMMTGDSERTAKAVAEKIGIDEFYAEVMPEDKAAFVDKEHAAGRKVIMIGDGINDSPALSAADAGVAISTGAAIAKEVADITVSSDDLNALVYLRRISCALMQRIHANYRMIISFNSALIALGVLGIIQPTASAMLHNLSTLAIGLKSMTDLLPDDE